MGREVSVITIGGKGVSLTSSSVFSVANGLFQVRIDSSALDRLPSTVTNEDLENPNSINSTSSSFLSDLTVEESRASLLLALNKCLLVGKGPQSLPLLISNALNDDPSNTSLDASLYSVLNVDEIVSAICGIVDHKSSVLSVIADAVAALSCEASRHDAASALNVVGESALPANKDEVGVANDLKVLLNGSRLVGKVPSSDPSFCEIPQVHGSFREICRLVHSRTRVQLNSTRGGGNFKALATAFLSLTESLRHLGMGSYSRAKHNVHVMRDVGLNESLTSLFERECPTIDALCGVFSSSTQACFGGHHINFFRNLNALLELVRVIVSWEAITAFVSLESSELVEKASKGGNSDNITSLSEPFKVSKKSENKKKKVVLGKGTFLLVQYIKDTLQSATAGKATSPPFVVEKCAQDLMSLLDPKHLSFPMLLEKVKEIVESNENRRLPKLPKGTRDFAKEQMAIREKAFSIIVSVFKRHGATALDTPAFELRETLMGKYGEDSKLVYDLADQGGELCSLRYDLTVPFARYVAMNGITSFKRYQIAKVYRRDNPSKGRYREFYQCDFDIAGQYETMGPDFEVIKVMTELLDELNIGDYEVKLNHRKLLDGMLDICGVPPVKFRTICSSIDKLDKQSFEQIRKEMVEEKGLSVDTADLIGTFVKERGPPLEVLSRLRLQGSKFLENEGSCAALNELEILFKALDKSKCINRIVFDLSLARGLDYYTGVIYEAVFKGATQVGSIAAGGRYDNLIGMFGTKQVPAVGVSLGIERVFTIMEQIHKGENQVTRATETQVLVSILGDDLTLAAEIASELWGAGIKAEFMVNKRVMKHIDRAKASRIPWVVIVGDHERNEGVVNLKDVEAAIDERLPRHRLVDELLSRIQSKSP